METRISYVRKNFQTSGFIFCDNDSLEAPFFEEFVGGQLGQAIQRIAHGDGLVGDREHRHVMIQEQVEFGDGQGEPPAAGVHQIFETAKMKINPELPYCFCNTPARMSGGVPMVEVVWARMAISPSSAGTPNLRNAVTAAAGPHV